MAKTANRQPQQLQLSLEGIAILTGLSPEARERLQKRCTWRRCRPGDPIVSYLDASDDVFFIVEGEVRVTIYSVAGRAVSFRSLGPGEVFGEYPAIDGGPRSASVEAARSSLIASIPAAAFQELLQTEPKVAQALLPQLVTKIRALTTRVYEFSTLAVNNRIQAELLRLASLGTRARQGCADRPGANSCGDRKPREHAPRGRDQRAQSPVAHRHYRAQAWRASGQGR